MNRLFSLPLSKQAKIYAQNRPTYPQSLYDFIAAHATAHDLAWDCTTENGQAAVDLAQSLPRSTKTLAEELSPLWTQPKRDLTWKLTFFAETS